MGCVEYSTDGAALVLSLGFSLTVFLYVDVSPPVFSIKLQIVFMQLVYYILLIDYYSSSIHILYIIAVYPFIYT